MKELHSLKAECNGLPVVMSPFVLYSDDTSGNGSKNGIKFDAIVVITGALLIRASVKAMFFSTILKGQTQLN